MYIKKRKKKVPLKPVKAAFSAGVSEREAAARGAGRGKGHVVTQAGNTAAAEDDIH